MPVQALVGHRSFLTLLFGTLLVLPAVANQYTLFVGNLMLLYIILALGLNILVGFAGQLALPMQPSTASALTERRCCRCTLAGRFGRPRPLEPCWQWSLARCSPSRRSD